MPPFTGLNKGAEVINRLLNKSKGLINRLKQSAEANNQYSDVKTIAALIQKEKNSKSLGTEFDEQDFKIQLKYLIDRDIKIFNAYGSFFQTIVGRMTELGNFYNSKEITDVNQRKETSKEVLVLLKNTLNSVIETVEEFEEVTAQLKYENIEVSSILKKTDTVRGATIYLQELINYCRRRMVELRSLLVKYKIDSTKKSEDNILTLNKTNRKLFIPVIVAEDDYEEEDDLENS